MANTSMKVSDTIKATFSFAPRENLKYEGEKYYTMSYEPGNGLPRCNYEYDEIQGVDVHNLRTSCFTLDTHGIGIFSLQSKMNCEDYSNNAKVENIYLREIGSLLMKVFKTEEVYIFDYTVRRRDPSFPYVAEKPYGAPQPAAAVHIDYSPADIRDRIRHLWKEDADSFLQKDFRAINVWKPIKGPVRDWPMAYCDPATVDFDNDVIELDDVTINHINEVQNLHYNPAHRWYYVPDQLPEEVVMFNEFDSRKINTAVPHCAFSINSGPDTPLRESIEVRALVFV